MFFYRSRHSTSVKKKFFTRHYGLCKTSPSTNFPALLIEWLNPNNNRNQFGSLRAGRDQQGRGSKRVYLTLITVVWWGGRKIYQTIIFSTIFLFHAKKCQIFPPLPNTIKLAFAPILLGLSRTKKFYAFFLTLTQSKLLSSTNSNSNIKKLQNIKFCFIRELRLSCSIILRFSWKFIKYLFFSNLYQYKI